MFNMSYSESDWQKYYQLKQRRISSIFSYDIYVQKKKKSTDWTLRNTTSNSLISHFQEHPPKILYA